MTEALPPGHVFHGRYEVVRCLNSGGMGAVYEVIHTMTRRRRALKVMLPGVVSNRDMHARFQLEARVAADIESEHIVETFDAGVDEDTGAPFLVMELLRGEDLGAVLARRGALPPDAVVGILTQVASALSRTHAAGVVHRDLKPENLFVTRRDDGTPKIKILDFGIAKVVADSGQAAARTKILGTPLYMSPEQIRGDGAVSARADLYALGHIAFTLLVGRAYWSAQARQDDVYPLMLKIAGGGGPAATTMAAKYGGALPAGFDAWFARATALDPQARFETAPELVEALAAVLGVPRAPAAAPFAWPAELSATTLPDAVSPFDVTSSVTDSLQTVAPSMVSLGPTEDVGSSPSLSAPDTIPMSSPPSAMAEPTLAPRSSRGRTGTLFVVVGMVVAAGLATRLVVRPPLDPGVTMEDSGRAPQTAPQPPSIGGDARLPSARPAAAPSEDAGSPRADETARAVVAASPSVAPRARPVRSTRPVETAAAPTATTAATAEPPRDLWRQRK